MPRPADAELQVLAGTGHLSPLESTGELAQCIGAFVERLAAAES
jgi:pimeloyl-ACP methyl ester carboxylesterase